MGKPRQIDSRHRAYAAMLAESKKTGLPRRFETDLTVHDKAFVEGMPLDTVFVWSLSEHGTHVIELGDRRTYEYSGAQLVEMVAKGDPDRRFYVWDGVELHPQPSWQQAAHCAREIERQLSSVDRGISA